MRQLKESPSAAASARVIKSKPSSVKSRSQQLFSLDPSDFWTHVGLVIATAVTVVLPRIATTESLAHARIYLIGAAIVLVVAAIARRRADGSASTQAPPMHALRAWVVERGVLSALIAAPLVALIAGLMDLLQPAPAYGYLALAFVALPIWIAWRRGVGSTDEPVHQLHRYALYSAFPYIVFTLVRIPAFYAWDFVYWMPWYLFGGAPLGTTGTPTTALAAGALFYSMQGYALALGYFVLFRRHNFINMFLYFVVLISSLYSFVFPGLLMVGSHPGWRFHLINFWAHLCMGVTAWAAPALWDQFWPRLSAVARAGLIVVLALAWLTPYGFAFGQATTWQADKQRVIEREAFENAVLALDGQPIATGLDGYAATLRYGPRAYDNYAHAERLIEVEVLDVDARITEGDAVLGWCRPLTRGLPSLRSERDPSRYASALERFDFSRIDLVCNASGVMPTPGTRLGVHWTAKLELAGEREIGTVTLSGQATTDLRP